MKIFVLLVAVVAGVHCHAEGWSYADKYSWPEDFATCAGQRQSPINFTPEELTCGAGPHGPVHASFGGMLKSKALDNGAEIVVEVPKGLSVKIGSKTYKVLQFHFHWGLIDTLGSEHTIDGKHHPMEMHVVATDGKQLALLGFFYKIGAENAALSPLVSALSKLQAKGSHTEINISLDALTAPAIKGPYYRYMGSLTTPPCTEGQIWTNFQTPLEVSQAQLNEFRTTVIKGNNFRPTQATDGRTIYNSAC